ncbi:hypothetical protein ACNOYE_32110 [Nannocystaceae bacterium ST9]
MHRAAIAWFVLALSLACQAREPADGDTLADTSDDEVSASDSTSSEDESSSSTTTDDESSTTTESSTTDESESSTTGESDSTEGDATGDEWLAECPSVADPTMQATIGFTELGEASGMVHSRSQDLLWAHNDSGDSPRIFAFGLDGQRIATLELPGVLALDWEDLAIGPGPGPGDWLYAGDIGDNAKIRPWITIVRVPEPLDVARLGVDPIVADDIGTIDLTYPDGPHDAEALMIDPITGDLYIVSKAADTQLFRRPAPITNGELEELPMPNFPSAIATASDISAKGDFIAVRGYSDAFGWIRALDQSVGEAMLGEPCELPLAAEMQGEIFAFESTGAGYFTLSEGTNPPLWWYAYQ